MDYLIVKKSNTFLEQYEVHYHYKGGDGYWEYGCAEIVCVPVRHGIKEKCNHDIAQEIFKQKYPKRIIDDVIYC